MTEATSSVPDHRSSDRSVRARRSDPVGEGVVRDCLAADLERVAVPRAASRRGGA